MSDPHLPPLVHENTGVKHVGVKTSPHKTVKGGGASYRMIKQNYD